MKKLFVPALRNFLIGVIALGILLFIPAWTLNYWQAWVFIMVFNLCTTGIGLYLSLNDPALLERRKKFGPAQETSPAQKVIMTIALVAVLALLVVPALDHHFGWSPAPAGVSVLGNALIVLSFYIFYRVYQENSFGGSTIEVVGDQKVITTGLYGVIRHPMYMGVLVMLTGVPLALGSWWGLAVLLIALPGLVWRILDEEKVLRKDLPGYSEYLQKVHYRLVPYLW